MNAVIVAVQKRQRGQGVENAIALDVQRIESPIGHIIVGCLKQAASHLVHGPFRVGLGQARNGTGHQRRRK